MTLAAVPISERLQQALDASAERHGRLCPRQVLGVRIGLAGVEALGFDPDPVERRLLAFVETDGCFVDGIEAATGCAVGHRTLRVHDYGKVAAVFVDVTDGRAVRIAPRAGIRQAAARYAPEESRRYYAQLAGYAAMPAHELLEVTPVELLEDLTALMGRAGVRVECSACAEEIMNGRQVIRWDAVLCRGCAGGAYFRASPGVRA
ncbi:MAG: FmdE family protein [Dehalococcoidia bacterium]